VPETGALPLGHTPIMFFIIIPLLSFLSKHYILKLKQIKKVNLLKTAGRIHLM
jgi:hypothetical protein